MAGWMAHGHVQQWNDEDGVGVVVGPDFPGGACWVGWGAIRMTGFQTLTIGQPVQVEYEPGDQDGFQARALTVTPL